MADFRAIEVHGAHAGILEDDARFGEHDGGPRDIPILGATAHHSGIELAGRHLDQAIGEGWVGWATRVFEPDRLQLLLHGPRRWDQRRHPVGRRAAREWLAVERRSATAMRTVHLIARRSEDDTSDRYAVLHHCERHGPTVLALDEPARAVDRVDDEDTLVLEALEVVGRLFAEPALVETCRGQGREQ